MKYAKIINSIVDNISFVKLEGYIEVTDNVEHGATQNDDGSFTNLTIEVTPEQLTATYKDYYLEVINTKLRELDYDSISTVSVWVSDPTFGTEANNILTWYKAIIAFNYQMINDIKAGIKAVPTKDEYLAQLPKYQG